MDSIVEGTPDTSRRTSTNDHIADINNVRLDSRVQSGQPRKAHASPSKSTAAERLAPTPKRLRGRNVSSVRGRGPPSPILRVDLSSGRVLASAVGAVPSTATGVIQPPIIIRPSPPSLDLFNAIEGESVMAQATVLSTIDVQEEGRRDGALANDAASNAAAPIAGQSNTASTEMRRSEGVNDPPGSLLDAAQRVPVRSDAEVPLAGRSSIHSNDAPSVALPPVTVRQKKKSNLLVPKSDYLNWMRDTTINSKKKYTEARMKSDLRDINEQMMHMFDLKGFRATNKSTVEEIDQAPATRSSIIDDDYWFVDTEAINCQVVETRRLDRYPLEHLLSLKLNTQLLLLVRVSEDDNMFSSKGRHVCGMQNIPTKNINGIEYFQLKCKLSDVNDNLQINSGVYKKSQFENDFKKGKAGFQVQFDGTDEKAHFTWLRIISSPLTFMFFGPPLTKSRSFDSIFLSLKSLNTVHARFLAYYNEFVGDLIACLFLKNAYLHRRLAIMESNANKKAKESRTISGSIFRSKNVLQFVNRFNTHCKEQIEREMCSFRLGSTIPQTTNQ